MRKNFIKIYKIIKNYRILHTRSTPGKGGAKNCKILKILKIYTLTPPLTHKKFMSTKKFSLTKKNFNA